MGLAIYHWKAMDTSIMTQVKFLAKCTQFKSSLKSVLLYTKKVNRIFESISKLFIGMRQMRWRWKAAANPLLPNVETFSKFSTVK